MLAFAKLDSGCTSFKKFKRFSSAIGYFLYIEFIGLAKTFFIIGMKKSNGREL
jgi:phosphate starvation-inducible membrane PsiE